LFPSQADAALVCIAGLTMDAIQSMVTTLAATATTTTPVLLAAECAAGAAHISRAISLEHAG
jgi:hypothetical protein